MKVGLFMFKRALALFVIGIFSIYHAWSIYAGKPQIYRRFDKWLALDFGETTLALVWLILGIVCLIVAYKIKNEPTYE